MVISDANIHNIMGGMESTAGVRLHNHRRKLKQRFDIIKKLGQGTYGKVQLGINKETGQEVAIKTIKKAKIETEADLVRIRREIQIMSSVQHPNIIHIYEVFENREKMVLVMEYAAGGELYDFLSEKKVLSEEEARRIFRQIATAVYYCHKHKICHRDLKLENILLDEHGSAKIADFGLSNVFNDQRLLNTFCGSPLYASPEIVKGTPYHGPEVDCWSLGVLLYTLVYGAMPFDGSNFKRLVKQISQGDYFEPKKPSPASPLIREMLTVTPARRANIEKICAHWWVNEGHTDSCLDIAEELANQTPVRLDLLLSLAPPPASGSGSDMLLTNDQGSGNLQAVPAESSGPARCHSVGSIMDLDQPAAEMKLKEFERQKRKGSMGDTTISLKDATKRKLEEGVSTDDAVHGAKKKDLNKKKDSKQSTENKSLERPSSQVKTGPEIENKVNDEKMDVDIETQAISSSEVPCKKDDNVKNNMQVVEGDVCTVSDVPTPDTISLKAPEKETAKTSLGRDSASRKSVKGSVKKSKPSSTTDAASIATKVSQSNEVDITVNTKQNKDQINNLENSEQLEVLPPVMSNESMKEKDIMVEPVTEASKQKIKKKKKVLSSKEEEKPNLQGKIDDVGTDDSSLQSIALDSKSEGDSNKVGKNEVNQSEMRESSEINSMESSLNDKNQIKPDTPRTGSVKTRKNLSLGKLSLNPDKSSVSEDLASPTKPVERRRSKIFENSDQFNIFLKGTAEPKSPVGDKPKKVFIPGVKVSDYKQAFERRSSLSSPSLKNSSSKKMVDQVSKNSKSNICDNDTDAPEEININTNSSPSNLVETSSNKTKEEVSSTSAITQSSNQNTNENIPNSVELTNKSPILESGAGAVESTQTSKDDDANLKLVPALEVTDKMSQQEKARIKKLKDAVDVISNAIAEETKRDSSDSAPVRKISSAKPPVPSSFEKKSKGAVVSSTSSKLSSTIPAEKKITSGNTVLSPQSLDVGSNDLKVESSVPEELPPNETIQKEAELTANKKGESETDKSSPTKKKSAKVEITLKSATLPRRKTSKAEIQLGYVPSKILDTSSPGEYRTEVEHMVGDSTLSRLQNQRSEVAFPVAAAENVQPLSVRSTSLEPEGTLKSKNKPRERIIPIQVEQEGSIATPPVKPPVPPLQQQKLVSQRSSSLSRQSTQDSDTDSTMSVPGPEPIRKSPREYIIPIAVEGGGYVTPRSGSLEPSISETSSEPSHRHSSNRSRRLRKMGSLLSDSEDEGFNSPFATFQRHSSVGRDGDNADDDRSFHHMHRLRSSKPRRATLEPNDSLSSAEEEDDDDDDGFEILTAESLFSTLLSRVRSLTQRLNVEDGGRSGFPTSRLMSHLAASGHSSPSSGLWSNVYAFPGEPLSRRVSETSQFSSPFGNNSDGPIPWRRSATRDISDGDSVYSEADGTSFPRGSSRFDCGSLSDDTGNDLNYSYYTPSLTRRIQRPWYSSSQPFGSSSSLTEQNSPSDLDWSVNRDNHSSRRKSSTGSLSSQNINIPQHSSRRLARTLSLHSRTDERNNKGIQGDTIPQYSRSHSMRRDDDNRHQPSRRSLRSLDTKDKILSNVTSRGANSSSDLSECSISRHLDFDRVLPPLPYSAGSRDRRRESSSKIYNRNYSLDVGEDSHQNIQMSKTLERNVHTRPHHSSSLPVISRTKGKRASDHERTDKEERPSTAGYDAANTISRKFSPKSHTNNFDSTNRKVVDNDILTRKKTEDKSNSAFSPVKKEDSKIPSLLHLSSSTRGSPKGKSNDKKVETEENRSTVRKSKSISSSNTTPDRSILSKFFRQGSEEKEANKTESAGDDKDKKKRRISRFLRPDFYDTPREESIYAKKKDEKAITENDKHYKCENTPKIKTELDENGVMAQINVDNKRVEAENNNNISTDISATSTENITKSKYAKKEVKGNKKDNNKQTKSIDDTKENGSIKNDNKKVGVFEKQASNANNKSGFLLSLEKKLEKFKSSGDDTASSNNTGKSRVDKAIRSLREKSLSHHSDDIVTSESNLLKRAVSVDDCCTMASSSRNQVSHKENSSSKLGSKVNSVLGLFRKLEDSPRTSQSPPQSSVLSRLRRTQSVYAGSQSDSVLIDSKETTKNTPVPPTRLKKTHSNSSVTVNTNGKATSSIQNNLVNSNLTSKTSGENVIDEGKKKSDVKSNEQKIKCSKIEIHSDNKKIHTISTGTATDKICSKLVKNDSIKNKSNNDEKGNTFSEKSSLDNNKIPSYMTKNDAGLKQTKTTLNVDVLKPESSTMTPEASLMCSNTQTVKNNLKESLNQTDINVERGGELNTSSLFQSMPTRDYIDNKTSVNANESNIGSEWTPNTHQANDENTLLAFPQEVNQLPTDDLGLNDDEIKFASVKRLDTSSFPGDESSVVSPADESESFDSWSVCSDFEGRDFPPSPVPSVGDEAEESVGDRIRRKSFYSRFNDIKKKHRKSSLSSIGSLPYRDTPSSLHHHRKKDYHADFALNTSHREKPTRSQSLYAQSDYDSKLASFSRKSPILMRSQHTSPTLQLGTENDLNNVNGFVGSESELRDNNNRVSTYGNEVPRTILGGSMETLKLPRHFNCNVSLGASPYMPAYSSPTRRASDSHLSRSIDSNTGGVIPRSQLPISSRYSGSLLNSQSDIPTRGGETHIHGKYNRFNLQSPLDTSSSTHFDGSTAEEESDRHIIPH